MPSKKYSIVRCSMGVFLGFIEPESTETTKVVSEAIRLWRWYGAASLSQLAMEGTSQPKDCKFGVPVTRIELTSPTYGFEILSASDKAVESILSVKPWRA